MQLADLELSFTRVTGAGLQHLKGLKELRSLSLSHTPAGGHGFENISELTQLQSIDLYETKLSDSDLEHMGHSRDSLVCASGLPKSLMPV